MLKNSWLKIVGVIFFYIISGALCICFYEKLSLEYVNSLITFISGLLAVIVTIVILISALDHSYTFYSAKFLKRYKQFYMVPVSTLCLFSTYILCCVVYGHFLLVFKEVSRFFLAIFFFFSLPILFMSILLPCCLWKFIDEKYDEFIDMKKDEENNQ